MGAAGGRAGRLGATRKVPELACDLTFALASYYLLPPPSSPIPHFSLQTTYTSFISEGSRRPSIKTSNNMAGPAKKRQKREEKAEGELPQKKYYRQRAHANPFSDHDLT